MNLVKQPQEPSIIGRKRRCSSREEILKLLLLLVPCVIALWVPLYNSIPPELFGIPFFYWFQLMLIPVSALGISAADRLGKN